MSQVTTLLYDALVDFFKVDQWPYLEAEEQSALILNFEGRNARWTCYAQTREDQRQFIFYSLCPIMVPVDRRLAVAELLTRANYGLIIGNFELDLEGGEVRYKTSCDCEGLSLTPTLFKNVIYPNLAMMDQYLPDILAIIYAQDLSTEASAQAVG